MKFNKSCSKPSRLKQASDSYCCTERRSVTSYSVHAFFSRTQSVILLTVEFIILVHGKSLNNDVVLFRKEHLSIDKTKMKYSTWKFAQITWKKYIYIWNRFFWCCGHGFAWALSQAFTVNQCSLTFAYENFSRIQWKEKDCNCSY